jgi:dephospho-CoA kinase
VLIAALLICRSYSFQLTQARVRSMGGVLARGSIEARLEHLQNVSIRKSFLQRVLGIGSLEMTTAGLGPSIVWWHVARPTHVAERVRRAIDQAHTRVTAATGPGPPTAAMARRFPVIGLAGGIGAGKSAVARSFELRGCHVIDSDARAKAALDRPDVRDALVAWWGPSVLDPEGRVDRAKVASIIFAEPGQRVRLEKLVHPIVREDRAHMIQEAKAAGARGLVVDAPLLFEAGVDAECDCVVYVDAPRELRLHRVAESRGWDEQELDRREAAQLPLDEKRQRSQYVVENYGKLGSVDSQVGRILAQIEAPP